MTTPADDTAVEDAFEAFLAGRPVPSEAAELAVFAEAVRATATQPGRPNAALAELLATGLLTDQSSPSARTARSAGAPRGTRTRNRRRFAMIFPALLAKLLSAGAVAQAATGAGIVVVVATGAGATGILGSEVQDTITGVVGVTDGDPAPEGTTPVVDEPIAADSENPGVMPTPADVTTVPLGPVDELEVAAQAWVDEGPAGYSSFSAWVTAGAHDRYLKDMLKAEGRNFGSVVSGWARKKGVTEQELAAQGIDLDELTAGETESTSTPEPTVQPDPEDTVEVAGSDERGDERGDDREGRGNGNGNGKGHGGNGNGNGNGNGGKGNGRN
ncbi:hypothetical protein E4P40_20975 [Blastococcus sp. CT_GayMR20]|uniref:hypothetical protein n=1 Tax=Blastococcus sp. CT_GayMR20 TaxID=2559609 RepID=UPI0010737113|nr:hypothetical protein [Blastococcus sp. CT_GayMR20]TFV71546.1 hypothetical protein E4P40_20975 [Blastococcus sp. CT_GayMR20]